MTIKGMRCGELFAAAVFALALTACGGGGHQTIPPAASVPGGPAPAADDRRLKTSTATYKQLCMPHARKKASCTALQPLTGAPHHVLGGGDGMRRTLATTPVGGWYPSDLASAYGLPSLDPTIGSNVTIAIVDAFDAPTAEADLGVYRSYMGLPPCTTANGCFKKVNQRGVQGSYPPSGQPYGWTSEIALDLDAVSAICPNCKIVLVESDDDYLNNLAAAVDTAATLASVISNSYYAPEVDPFAQVGDPPVSSFAPSYQHAGKVTVAGTGDNGFQTGGNAPFPAGVPQVVAVGGTTLTYTGSGGRPWSEAAWSASGGGCSTVFAKPSWQTDSGCAMRITADVAASADGLAVYDSLDAGGWTVIAGTSEATPIIAGLYGLGGNPSTVNSASSIYSHASSLNDITTGSTGTCSPSYFCTAGAAYDGPTGMGSPYGTLAFGGTAKQWRQIAGTATDVAASDTALWVVNGTTAYVDISGTFVADTPGTSVSRIAMGPTGIPWVAAQNNQIYRRDPTVWNPYLCCGTDLGVGRNNDVWFIQPGGNLYEFPQLLQAVNASRVSVSADGYTWMVDTSGNVSQYSASWMPYGCCFSDVAAGKNNQAYAIGSDHNSVWQFNGSTWTQVRTGSATNITVTPTKGIPIITDASGNIFVFD
jgi:hypothetical protein